MPISSPNKDYLIVIIGIVALYAPTIYDLANSLWMTDEQSYGSLVFLIELWLLYRAKDALLQLTPKPVIAWGGFVFGLGLIIYVLGRLPNIPLFEVGSLILIMMGCTLIMIGSAGLRVLWFPLFFIIFMVPIPGSIIDAMTQPMKIAVSYVTENILYNLGFPIARTGVILHIGSYQLLVADVCAGMHTLISLEGLGLLYLNLVQHDSKLRNLFMAILIIPISFTANVTRVIVLTLVTFYYGADVGQGFVHGFAGIVLFSVALLLTISADSLIQKYVDRRANRISHA
ncbi:exosortase B [Methylomonas sp. AM2-LC]|uniref:exosortase B n=1 Tax=Methylomonas sp. AM2-LC TaxID=3153301 RepID=UPI0032664619